MSDFERESLAADERWRTQQIEAEKRTRLAQLTANPATWFEAAQLEGKIPGVFAWQVPLMPQEYFNIGVGEKMPGYKNLPEQSQLPALTKPSIQYLARMGPTARQQYYGYQRAATGAPIEETLDRIRAQAPPSGWNQPLQWNR